MRISIVCPVHDTPPSLLAAAARSVLHDPSGAVRQLILVNGGSRREDTRRALVEIEATDPRVTLIEAPCGQAAAGARNLALAAARHDWIGFLDADGIWLPGQPARLSRLLAEHPDAIWIGTRHRIVFADGASESVRGLDSPRAQRPVGGPLRIEAPALAGMLLGEAHLPLGAIVVRRDLAEAVGGFAEGLPSGEEALFLAKVAARAPLHYIDAEGYGWRGERSPAAGGRGLDLALYAQAERDPMLRGFRREIRRARYAAIKVLALDHLRAGRRYGALGLALRGWMQDPREVSELLLFLRLWRRGVEAEAARRYSRTERLVERRA